MGGGDVLSIPFPPITVPLFPTRPPAPPLSRRQPHRLNVYLSATARVHGREVRVELLGPPASRWRTAMRAAWRTDRDGQPPWQRLFSLALEAMAVLPEPPAEDLWTPRFLQHHWAKSGVLAYRHQLETARRALFEMGGRAILADEVGLGKTVEAGIILHELLLRRLARRTLILVPAGLMWQWYRELREKFDVPVELQASERDWERAPLLVASLDTAKREPHRSRVLSRPYDLLIVDEAHRLRNHRTGAFQLVCSIRSRYLLLLTATPMHNSLRELHALCYLVSPETVGELPDFVQRFGVRGRRAEDAAGLRGLVSRLVVRHRRAATPIPFTQRVVHTRAVDLSPPERELYDALDALAVATGRSLRPDTPGEPALTSVLVWLTLKREACSSPPAAASTLRRLAGRHGSRALQELAERAEAILHWAKAQAVAELVRDLGDEHVLLFTEYSATQDSLARHLAQLGRPVVLFHGSLTAMQREWAQAVFRDRAPIMVCTDAGAEGVNLQFCRHLINVDLPWNPMRLEQRIGRLHRLGQTRDVHIWNLYCRDTVDEYVLYLLHDKLNLFRAVVGEVDRILEPIGGASGFERALARALAAGVATSSRDVEQAIEELVREWNTALRRFEARMEAQRQVLDAE